MALIKILNDDSPMPLGKYRGRKMANVPYWYFLWYEAQPLIKNAHDRVKEDDAAIREYIKDNRDVLLAEEKQARQSNRNPLFNPYQ